MTDSAVVTHRMTWTDVLPFPGNPIFEGRLRNMAKRWDGYRHSIVGVPEFADNSANAFPDLPATAILNLDANHRQELARRYNALDMEFIARIHRGLTRVEMLNLRRGLADRRTVKPAEVFLSMCVERPLGVERGMLDLVEGAGWRITCEREYGGLACVQELSWIYRHDKTAMVLAIRTYEAVFGRDGVSGQGQVIKGLGAFWVKYPDADADRVVRALKRIEPDLAPSMRVRALYRSGRAIALDLSFLHGTWQGIRYSVAKLYNQAGRKGQLAP